MKRVFAIAIALFAAQPLAAQQSIETPGTIPHVAAGASFAERVGAFRRVNTLRYDQQGRDVSANYDLARPEGRVRASIYIYPALTGGPAPSGEAARIRLCNDEFAEVGQAIRRNHKESALVEETPAPRLGGIDSRYSHRSVHRFRADIGGGVEDLQSESRLYCFVGGDWLVKYRISSSVGMDVRGEIEAFIRDGAWPGRAGPQNIVSGPGKGAVAR